MATIAHGITGGSMLESGWSQDHPGLKKKSLFYIKFYDFFTLKKCVTTLNFF